MIRRFRLNVERQDWFAVIIDLAIVVVGVYLGIQASNWNQDRQDRAVVRELRAQIIDNLKANEADLLARASYYRQIRGHAIAALAAVQVPSKLAGEAWLVDAYQASQVWLRPFEVAAFDELQKSGLAGKLGDVQTRTAITSYVVTANGFETTGLSTTGYREKLRRGMDLKTQIRIKGECGDRYRPLPGGRQAPTLPESCRLGMNTREVEVAIARVASIPELDQELTRLIVDIDQKQALFSRMLGYASNLRTRLERT